MVDQYAIVPYAAQAEMARFKQAFEPRDVSQQYAMTFFRFLDPLLQE